MKISVIITSYNHEKYIAQCFDSVLAQQGDFEMEIVVGDDCSRDNTGRIIERYRKSHPDLIRVLPSEKNVGITRNLKRCLDACTGEYIAICEGDDYWTQPYKLQRQMEFLAARPDYAMCFSLLTMYYEKENKSVLFQDQVDFPSEEVTIQDLIQNNVIGNFSCCMYRTESVRCLSPNLFDFFTVDWMFNMAISEVGRLGFIRETMSVYRKHSLGAWTGKPEDEQIIELLVLIDTYNHFLGYRYNSEFSQKKRVIEDWSAKRYGEKVWNRMHTESRVRSPYPPPPLNGHASTPVLDEAFPAEPAEAVIEETNLEPEDTQTVTVPGGSLEEPVDDGMKAIEQEGILHGPLNSQPVMIEEVVEDAPGGGVSEAGTNLSTEEQVDQEPGEIGEAPVIPVPAAGQTPAVMEQVAPPPAAAQPAINRGLKASLIYHFKNIFRPYWHWVIRTRNRIQDGSIITWQMRMKYANAKWQMRVRYEKTKFAILHFPTYVRANVLGTGQSVKARGTNTLANVKTGMGTVKGRLSTATEFLASLPGRLHTDYRRSRIFSKTDLLILDTVFPHPLSPFRFHEFKSYLERFPKSTVLMNGDHLLLLGETRGAEAVIQDFEQEYPEFQNRVLYDAEAPKYIHGKLAYATFLNNIKRYIDVLEAKKIPFVFTLYPGGGFQIDQEESDNALRRVIGSPQFRKVIVTQKLTYDYLIKKQFCPADRIEFIYGVVTPPPNSQDEIPAKKHFGFGRYTLNVCFVAYKYSPRGVDKGYDVFIDAARNLIRLYGDIQFHIVGNFDETDVPVHDLGERIKFYGVQKREWFDSFFADKDIILSPNIPYVLVKGAFDGFPTSACTDAALREVAIFCTDDLCQNIMFKDREEIVLISHDPQQITEMVAHYHDNPYELRDLAQKGAERMREIYSDEIQLGPRMKILEAELRRASR